MVRTEENISVTKSGELVKAWTKLYNELIQNVVSFLRIFIITLTIIKGQIYADCGNESCLE
jgi:hypothetical protein